MKGKLLQVRMSEEELDNLKEFTERVGFKNSSETVRESLKAFSVIAERDIEASRTHVKACDASSILWATAFLNNTFNIQEYFSSDNKKSSEEFNSMLIEMYDAGDFKSLKKSVLKSIHNDFLFSNEIDKDLLELIKEISIEFLKKQ